MQPSTPFAMIEFDAAKDASNLIKHGVSLAFGAQQFGDPHRLVVASVRLVDGEERSKVIGQANQKLYTGVHVRRGENIRFISVRRSNDGETRAYHSVQG